MLLKNNFPRYNNFEKKGLLALLSIIFILQLIYFYNPFSGNDTPIIDVNSLEIVTFQKRIDSLRKVEIENRKSKIYPFNPSFLSDYKASKLGMSISEIDRLLAHRKAGGYISSAEEFQQVTHVNDSLLASISPHFKFPDWVTKKTNNAYKTHPFNPSFLSKEKGIRLGMSNSEIEKLLAHRENGKYINSSKEFQQITGVSNVLLNKIKPYFKFPDWVVAKNKIETNSTNVVFTGEKTEINKVTASELQQINGIGEKLSKRIITYRNKLKGYSFDSQLYEVWGLEKEVATKILERYTVITKPTIEKVNINTAHFKKVLHLPYIDYELTKKMFDLRDEVAELQTLEELKQIDSFPLDKYDRISLYLKAE